MLFPGSTPSPIVDELRERLVEELDYRIEADNQRLFVDDYRGHPFIHVPDVLDELSHRTGADHRAGRGRHVRRGAGLVPDDERNLAAETIYRFAFGGIYRLHAFNGDPHPGNYLFRPGGQVTFLDFGLCKRFTDRRGEGRSRSMIRPWCIDRDLAEVPPGRASDVGLLHRRRFRPPTRTWSTTSATSTSS